MPQPLLEQSAAAPTTQPAGDHASLLFEALERLEGFRDLATLRPAIVTEARGFVPAEAVGVGSTAAHDWRLDHLDAVDGSTEQAAALMALDRANRLGLLDHPGVVVLPPPTVPAQLGGGSVPDCVLVVDLGLGTHSRRHSLWWVGQRAAGLPAMLPLAILLGRYAGLALRNALEQDSLHEAAASRNRIGQAQGILMALHEISADEAFALLRQVSQGNNIKLTAVAAKVVELGRLPLLRPRRRSAS